MPRSTFTYVPSHRSAVSHRVPRTVADANRPRVRNFPLPSPHTWRTTFAVACLAVLVLRLGQAPKLPLASRISTTRFLPSVARASVKAAVTPPAPEIFSVPTVDWTWTVPWVTSTTVLNGIVPPVNGRPLTSTVPVTVAVGGGIVPPPDGVVVVVGPPPPPPPPPVPGLPGIGGAPASTKL